MSNEVTAYTLKIELTDSAPLIWRELEVLSNMSLNNLWWSLALSMGWECSHLYVFTIDGVSYGDIEHDYYGDFEDDRKVRVRDLVSKGISSFGFTYDFGDNWVHTVTLGKEVQAKRDKRYPFCIAGEHACPPEDCGGMPGFEEYKNDCKYLEKFDLTIANMSLVSKKIPKNIKIKKI